MRLVAYHDRNGNIIGLAASPSDDFVPAEVTTSLYPGLRMTQVDLPSGITVDSNNPKHVNEAMDRIIKNYQVVQGAFKRKS
jgi:hypothetical protein